jgi:RNA polymerase sigma-70 factor (ECF subfamily)
MRATRSDGLGTDADLDLVRAARADAEVFGELYLRHLPRIHRYLRSRCASDEDASDLAQDVFERAHRALPAYRETEVPFAAWLFTIARNRSADAARQTRRRPPSVSLPDGIVGSGGPEDEILRAETTRELLALVADLDPARQELLTLRFGAGLSSREIGLVLGRSEAAVQQEFTRLLRTLKERWHAR